MAFLKKKDVESSIRATALTQIIDNDDTVFEQAALEAEGILAVYLSRYDVAKDFKKIGNNRNKALMFYAKNITLYSLYERVYDDDVPDRIIKNYDDTIAMLNKISEKKMSFSNLDSIPEETQKSDFRYGKINEGKSTF